MALYRYALFGKRMFEGCFRVYGRGRGIDGCVAQTRLLKMMLSNSVVVKEDSDWIEYYYR